MPGFHKWEDVRRELNFTPEEEEFIAEEEERLRREIDTYRRDHPDELLRNAAEAARYNEIDSELHRLLVPLLELAAADLEMCERQNSRDPDNDGKTRIMPSPFVVHALKIGRLLLEMDDVS